MITILQIEDNKDISDNTAELLELEGYEVITAGDGAEGILLAETHQPDLIISDVVMGETDGYEVFQALLKSERTRNIPFIFTTAKAERSDIEKAFGIGPCGYLIKPYDGQELYDCVKKALKKNMDLK